MNPIAPPRDGVATPLRACLAIELPYQELWPLARGLIGRLPGVVLLDSGGPAEAAGWSILGWEPRRVVAWPQGAPGAFAELRRLLAAPVARPPEGSPLPFHGGWIGWLSYDLGRHVERLPSIAVADPGVPDFVLGEYDVVLVEDRLHRRLFAAGICDNDGTSRRIREKVEALLGASERAPSEKVGRAPSERAYRRAPSTWPPAGSIGSPPRPALDRHAYRRRIERIQEHIRDGDIYQANFSYRWTSRARAGSATLYERLRAASPAPYGCYLGLPGAPEILSISPELFLRKRGRRIETRPIKGTRPRDADPQRDAALRRELERSEKERAELLMITDLLRNDLGRVATFGSVRVTTLRALESHPTVHHAYSTIEAELAPGADTADLLAATFPGGSVTGAPKIRAMEILEQLEPVRRGPYTGAAGFFGYEGDLCLNILIRTLVRSGDHLSYQVGGGIVADSLPDAEYEETLAKGAALLRALT